MDVIGRALLGVITQLGLVLIHIINGFKYFINSIFNKINTKVLQKYADFFQIDIEHLKNIESNKK